jgi:hypothetical protein
MSWSYDRIEGLSVLELLKEKHKDVVEEHKPAPMDNGPS